MDKQEIQNIFLYVCVCILPNAHYINSILQDIMRPLVRTHLEMMDFFFPFHFFGRGSPSVASWHLELIYILCVLVGI